MSDKFTLPVFTKTPVGEMKIPEPMMLPMITVMPNKNKVDVSPNKLVFNEKSTVHEAHFRLKPDAPAAFSFGSIRFILRYFPVTLSRHSMLQDEQSLVLVVKYHVFEPFC